MASEYTITYTYTGQGNTSATRSVPFSKFTASGDTNRTIGQITGIQYIHYHTSAGSMSWGLRGRLVLSDGTTFISDQIYHGIDGDVVKYTNTFASLPTAAQFAALTSVQTLDTKGKTTSGGYSSTLYWRANSSYPMRIIVKFIEEPPVVYAPEIDKFEAVRCNGDGGKDDEGQYIAATLKLSVGDSAGLSGAQCRIYYAANAYPQVGLSPYVDVTSRISELVGGVALNTSILTGVWSLGSIWNFAAVFVAGEETAIATSSVARGTTSFHISDDPGGGAAVGGFSTGTKENPKFESHVPAYFYAGIEGLSDYSAAETKTCGKWIDGKPIYRRSFVVEGKSISSGASTTEMAVIDNFAEIDTFINITGVIDYNGEIYPITRIYSSGSFFGLWINPSGSIRIRSDTSSTVKMERLVCTIEYTKLTD